MFLTRWFINLKIITHFTFKTNILNNLKTYLDQCPNITNPIPNHNLLLMNKKIIRWSVRLIRRMLLSKSITKKHVNLWVWLWFLTVHYLLWHFYNGLINYKFNPVFIVLIKLSTCKILKSLTKKYLSSILW